MKNSNLCAVDSKDLVVYPLDFDTVHDNGIPHRSIHLEIVNPENKYFVWTRQDGRLEIPGGHVDWKDDENRPETYKEAAYRELNEELNLSYNMSNGAASISDYLILIKKIINQVPSSHRNNNEWVTVFSLAWQYQWGDPILYKNLGDGSKNPCWLALDDIERESEKMPMGINAALRLFLQRRNILIPILRL